MHTDGPQFFRASLTDPSASFRHLLTAQRNAAISHESFLLKQLATLQEDLASVRSVIVGCDSALAATNPPTEETIIATQSPYTIDPNTPPLPLNTPVVEPPAPPLPAATLHSIQSELDKSNPPIPAFLSVPKVASAS